MSIPNAILAVLIGLGWLSNPLFSAETPPKLPSESIGGALLEDLDLDMLKKPAPKTPPPIAAAGEDLGQPSASSPLRHIEQGMRTAHRMLSSKSQQQQTVQVQQQVIDDLDELIEQVSQQQCQNCQKSQSESQSQSQQQAKQSQQKQNQSRSSQSASSSQTAAEDSSSRVGQGTAESEELESVPAIYKELWGHLPETVRQQLLQAPSDQFLPKYEKLLQKYFRRLAEEGENDQVGPGPSSL